MYEVIDGPKICRRCGRDYTGPVFKAHVEKARREGAVDPKWEGWCPECDPIVEEERQAQAERTALRHQKTTASSEAPDLEMPQASPELQQSLGLPERTDYEHERDEYWK